MIMDSRVPSLLLDLAECNFDKLEDWQAIDQLMRFKERALEILLVWPPEGFAAVRSLPGSVWGQLVIPDPGVQTPKETVSQPKAEPKKTWEATISTTRDPTKAAPNINLGLDCSRMPEK
jgi:hypothetical protein